MEKNEFSFTLGAQETPMKSQQYQQCDTSYQLFPKLDDWYRKDNVSEAAGVLYAANAYSDYCDVSLLNSYYYSHLIKLLKFIQKSK